MNRRTFFFLCAILATFFGSAMIFAPDLVSQNFQMQPSIGVSALFRAMGAMILSTGILNFLVRQHPDSQSLRSVLIFNVASHILNICADLAAAASGAMPFAAILPPQLVHIFIAAGSLYYLRALQRESAVYP